MQESPPSRDRFCKHNILSLFLKGSILIVFFNVFHSVSCGMVDQRLIEKYEREAVEKNRETWYLAYIMDVNEEERQKGKTVEVGKGSFETAKKRYTILDAPGHKSFVPNMIGGASQADIGILVISAKKGEFEAGFERGGQTREHAMLAKTLGISKLIVVINKMDDPSVEWSKERFDDITEKLSPYLKQVGYNVKKNVIYVPLSGYTGENIKNRVESKTCPWYEGKSLLDELDDLPPLNRDEEGALRLPIVDSYKFQGGVHVLGKLETGTLKINQKLIIQPIGLPVQVTGIIINENEVEMARPGENLTVALKGVEDGQIHSGFVLSSTEDLCPSSQKFDAKIVITELLLHKPLMTKGYSGILHIHSATIECEIVDIMREYNKKTGKVAKKRPPFIKSGAIADVRIELENSVCMEPFEVRAQLGRFTIRDEGKTVAIGKINRIQNIEKE